MLKRFVAGYAGQCSFVLFTALSTVGIDARAQSFANADALLAIDQHRASVVERIVAAWGPALAKSTESVSIDELRARLLTLRADQLFAATLAGTEEGLREVAGYATSKPSLAQAAHTKALGDAAADVVYTPVTPCRLVDTRGTFAAVYQGNGTASHTPVPFASNEIRTYTVQGGNTVCLTQLPAGLNPSAVQLQVFGMPTTNASGDIEILPQGGTFGSTATMVYVASINFNTVSTAAKINTADKQISVQVRGGGAHVAIDVVGYFAAPSGNGGKFFMQGGNAFGTTALMGTKDSQPFSILMHGDAVMRYMLGTTDTNAPVASPNLVGGLGANTAGAFSGQTVAGGGKSGTGCYEPVTNTDSRTCANQVANDFASIGGGYGNFASGLHSTVAGGGENTASADSTVVGGGSLNFAGGIWATVAGGFQNFAEAELATVGGGDVNHASFGATVAGGDGNGASGFYASITGGQHNIASNAYATVAGGSANTASGFESIVAGGTLNTASGERSFAAGHDVLADEPECAVLGFFSSGPANCKGIGNIIRLMANHGFSVDWGPATGNGGGTWWVEINDITPCRPINTYTNAYLSCSGVWTSNSDRDKKENFAAIDPLAVLKKVLALPVTQWNYKAEPGVLRIGPMAQDFYAAFAVGQDNVTIAQTDEAGVAFAAIQGLNKIVQEKDAKIEAQQHEIAELRTELDAVKRAVAQLISGNARVATQATP